jgi:hypothetical protein
MAYRIFFLLITIVVSSYYVLFYPFETLDSPERDRATSLGRDEQAPSFGLRFDQINGMEASRKLNCYGLNIPCDILFDSRLRIPLNWKGRNLVSWVRDPSYGFHDEKVGFLGLNRKIPLPSKKFSLI